MVFQTSNERSWLEEEDGTMVGYIDHPEVRSGVVSFEHTIVEDAYSGRGIAGELTKAVADQHRKDGIKAELSCSYSIKWFAKHPEYADVLSDPEAETQKAQTLAASAEDSNKDKQGLSLTDH